MDQIICHAHVRASGCYYKGGSDVWGRQPELGDVGVESTILADRKINGGAHEDKERIDVVDVVTPLIAPSRIPSHVVGPGTYCIE